MNDRRTQDPPVPSYDRDTIEGTPYHTKLIDTIDTLMDGLHESETLLVRMVADGLVDLEGETPANRILLELFGVLIAVHADRTRGPARARRNLEALRLFATAGNAVEAMHRQEHPRT